MFKSHRDVIADVISIKITFSGIFLTIFPYLMSKWTYLKYFEIFKMAAICRPGQAFQSHIPPDVEYNVYIASPIPYILSFWSTS